MTRLDVDGDPLADLLARFPDEPVVVVNLVRLKPGGHDAHRAYLAQVDRILERYGAKPWYFGTGLGTLIGEEHWDRAAITSYPSVRTLAAFIEDPAFLALAPLRHEALEAGIVHVFRQPPDPA